MTGDAAGTEPLKPLPLRERHVAAGARMAPFAGWEMPLQYSGIVAEHEAVRNAAGIFDVSHMGRVWVRGPEAGRQIRSATTYDVTRIEPGRTHYSLYCNEDGGIEDDIFVFRTGADRWLVVHNAANAAFGAERLRAAAGDAAEDGGAGTVMLAVQGPAAAETVTKIIGPVLAGLDPRACAEVEWRGATLLVSRTGYTGEDGAEVVADPEPGAMLWDAFVEAGVVSAGLGARDTLRLEAALPLHGHDITRDSSPYEAGLRWAVTLDDGAEFIGREALERLAAEKPRRRRGHLRLLERGVPREGYRVLDEYGGALSTLTSGAFSPTLRAGIAMAYLPSPLATIGTRLAVEIRERAVPAEVVRRPFYRREERSKDSE